MPENMDTIPKPFTIEIAGKPITKIDAIPEGREQAKIGSEPAVFELKDKRLQCDGHILARALLEDRSLAPKRVYWYPADTDEKTQDVTATKDGEEYRLHFASCPLTTNEEGVFAEMLDREDHSKVVLKMH
ncbi:hypothetical protein PtrSN002B_003807 [Pyrenophora tritici-repentis]|uniref:Inhibitor-I66 domain containing protein n=2 Tax=Pyrenophora tritici-repentis TaxID=45151 RepID=A0A2W1GCB8_9PLEO|nr:uncharacterized protein PTRG_11122 [Pyrenophora tritici-repentis Pt-1C-BFP]KAA8622251.1 Inhibitor-I66 domain-containing protein [Pyrenophora tritici-repentis]EDU44172.1 hypothetical protein PTRG_11122 [Pyrenophora tritici-repentis Pt-1C-BFP]KAF7451230.1 hypothetical protein A1F99_030070 [Pyrenophora tritici-repentis]KAF7575660.1 hypothetical protein PtrM4_072840 [Pyrenophora tritici-repentis]KAG9385599.1 Inhibitor I66 domain containing protein [Pyrenophora tritici-repentis]